MRVRPSGGAGSVTHDMKSLVCFCALTLWGTPLMLLVCLAYYLSPWPSKQGNRQLWNIDVTLVALDWRPSCNCRVGKKRWK